MNILNLVINAKRYVVKNGNDPAPGNIAEEKESELESFVVFVGRSIRKELVPSASNLIKVTRENNKDNVDTNGIVQ